MKATELRTKRIEFLKDTINHYNLQNRSQSPLGNGCYYSAAHENTQGCAIGRHIQDKDLCLKLDSMGGISFKIFNLLPNKLQELSIDFLARVQQLHDRNVNWIIKGLSKRGEIIVNDIITEFKLNVTVDDLLMYKDQNSTLQKME